MTRRQRLPRAETTTRRRVRVTGDLFHGRVPDGAVYVGRSAPGLPASRFANPHKVGNCSCGQLHNRADAVAAYRRFLLAAPALLDAARAQLAGADLACWCQPTQPCHADVLLDLIHLTPHTTPTNTTPASPSATATSARTWQR